MNKNKISKDSPGNLVSSDQKHSNPCIRCGKERIESKSWEEKVKNFMGTTITTHTQTVCPDPECQKIVEKELELKKKKKEEIKQNKEDRRIKFKEQRKNNITFSKASKFKNR